ncbi:hypothetical protein CAI21_10410 [Alkalilimnicola ehrlichii]|uniref:Polymer-forming cytoskeletal protein n=1 Tax=Alkalilimnicola ehrlichii TaxID=351052 RepID=A0A3E0WVR3_9GAMM|nr:polymer-forming cytoskeletal protein [Alkalilimnicola ehrlichii]RFA29173.1 hypothetical protein CAI21_10410 [Alkalilimnicola ehrlichii]RFA36086.1 hypothetical protein CAL65_11560 [Alkalilimnicola ehrlichii]
MFDRVMRGSRDGGLATEKDDEPMVAPTPVQSAPQSSARVRDAAVIGPSIQINGDLRGEEDLVIQGQVHGTIHLAENSLTVGSEGKVFADAYAHTIIVEGKVEGDLYGAERVAIKRSGDVRGNIFSPRVSLEDGGRFKGMIEMDEQEVRKAFGLPASSAAAGAPPVKRPEVADKAPQKPEEKAKTDVAAAK